jgi:hypothetical protein
MDRGSGRSGCSGRNGCNHGFHPPPCYPNVFLGSEAQTVESGMEGCEVYSMGGEVTFTETFQEFDI